MSEQDINRRIAEKLGWTEFVQYSASIGRWWAVPPGKTGRGFADANIEIVPDYRHDANAILDALPTVGKSGKCYDVSITEHVNGRFTASIVEDTPPMGRTGRWDGEGTTRQEALANAFEAYLQRG